MPKAVVIAFDSGYVFVQLLINIYVGMLNGMMVYFSLVIFY